MTATPRSDFPGIPCSDSGTTKEREVLISYWGPLVPSGVVEHFCGADFNMSRTELHDRLETKPRSFEDAGSVL